MRHFDEAMAEKRKAVIYCRVSGKKQTKEGSGLDSQEYRCRQYAEAKGYDVERVFPDDVSGGGDFMKRKGMVALLRYLDERSDEDYVVIFDDLKRYARDVEFHLKLRRVMKERGATRECLNFNFEDTPEGKFNEIISAAAGELEREQMGRQNRQKAIARVEQGYCVQAVPPIGYKYVKAATGGKVLVKDEPYASIVTEALEGYASGRFASQVEVKRFLEAQPAFPKNNSSNTIPQQYIVRILTQKLYAGLVGVPSWGVSIRKGRHEPLISVAAYERILQKLDGGVYASARKDISADFPLRGAVACSECETPLTSGWCKGKYKKYPYYFCRSKGCSQFGKTIGKKKIEGEFEELLKSVQPSKGLVNVASAMFKDCWDERLSRVSSDARALEREAAEIENKISQLIDKTLVVTNPRIVSALENRIEELTQQKYFVEERAANLGKPRYRFETLFELSIRFLASPCYLWNSGRLELRRLMLRLVFSGHLAYSKSEGFLNTNLSLPFNMLGSFCAQNGEMVPPG